MILYLPDNLNKNCQIFGTVNSQTKVIERWCNFPTSASLCNYILPWETFEPESEFSLILLIFQCCSARMLSVKLILFTVTIQATVNPSYSSFKVIENGTIRNIGYRTASYLHSIVSIWHQLYLSDCCSVRCTSSADRTTTSSQQVTVGGH